MSFTSTLTSKNQTTIPEEVVEVLQLKPSATLHYEVEEGGRVVLTDKTGTFAGLADPFRKRDVLSLSLWRRWTQPSVLVL